MKDITDEHKYFKHVFTDCTIREVMDYLNINSYTPYKSKIERATYFGPDVIETGYIYIFNEFGKEIGYQVLGKVFIHLEPRSWSDEIYERTFNV